jgi:cellobiose-specific phosphotransferase system component IIC
MHSCGLLTKNIIKMTKKITKMPIDTEFSYWLYKNNLEDWNKLWELSKEYEAEQLTIPIVGTRFSTRSFIIGCGCGMTLGLMLAIIIINVC